MVSQLICTSDLYRNLLAMLDSSRLQARMQQHDLNTSQYQHEPAAYLTSLTSDMLCSITSQNME